MLAGGTRLTIHGTRPERDRDSERDWLMMALTPKRLFLYLCISISLLRPYTLFSRSPLVNKTLYENACELEWVVLYLKNSERELIHSWGNGRGASAASLCIAQTRVKRVSLIYHRPVAFARRFIVLSRVTKPRSQFVLLTARTWQRWRAAVSRMRLVGWTTVRLYIYIYLASDSSQDHILTEGLAVLAPKIRKMKDSCSDRDNGKARAKTERCGGFLFGVPSTPSIWCVLPQCMHTSARAVSTSTWSCFGSPNAPSVPLSWLLT